MHQRALDCQKVFIVDIKNKMCVSHSQQLQYRCSHTWASKRLRIRWANQHTYIYRQTLFHFADGKISETLNLNEKCKLRILNCCCCFFFSSANVLKHAELGVGGRKEVRWNLIFFPSSLRCFFLFCHSIYKQTQERKKKQRQRIVWNQHEHTSDLQI